MSLKVSFLLSGFALLIPGLALPSAVTLNGACEAGNCAIPDTLNPGGNTGGHLGFTYTLSNGDQFAVSGFYGATFFNAKPIPVGDPVARYLGNTGNSSAASGADVLTFNFWQTFNTSSLPTLDGFYSYYFISNTSGAIASSSAITGNELLNGESIGATTVGTGYSGTNGFNQACFGPGGDCASYGYTESPALSSPLTTDLMLSFAFGSGSGVGSEIAILAPSPEPGSILLLSLGGFALVAFAVTRRTKTGYGVNA